MKTDVECKECGTNMEFLCMDEAGFGVLWCHTCGTIVDGEIIVEEDEKNDPTYDVSLCEWKVPTDVNNRK